MTKSEIKKFISNEEGTSSASTATFLFMFAVACIAAMAVFEFDIGDSVTASLRKFANMFGL